MSTIRHSVVVWLWAMLAGCGREAKGPPQPPQLSELPTSPRGPVRMTEASVPAVVIPDTGDVNATLQQLTVALRDFVVRTRSVPKNFDEFAAKSQARFPPPPAGQKYAIQGQKVVLVNG
ncbi:MAG: hypothetical protein ACLQU3_02525 [Limisphaerales bacterium]